MNVYSGPSNPDSPPILLSAPAPRQMTGHPRSLSPSPPQRRLIGQAW